MAQKNISFTSVGDCCIDQYVLQKKRFLGGGSFNVVSCMNQLGASASIISSIGDDAYGKAYLSFCNSAGILTKYLTTVKGETSTIDILLKGHAPEFTNWNLGVLKDRILSLEEKQFLQTQDVTHAILFSPMLTLFEEYCSIPKGTSVKIGDFSGVSQYNQSVKWIEKFALGLDVFVKSFDEKNEDEIGFLKDFAKKEDKLCIALLGKKGSMVFSKERQYVLDALQTTVVDTSGAGDTYIAHFAYWYTLTKDISYSMEKATIAASKIITRLGVGEEITTTL